MKTSKFTVFIIIILLQTTSLGLAQLFENEYNPHPLFNSTFTFYFGVIIGVVSMAIIEIFIRKTNEKAKF